MKFLWAVEHVEISEVKHGMSKTRVGSLRKMRQRSARRTRHVARGPVSLMVSVLSMHASTTARILRKNACWHGARLIDE